MNNDNTKSLGLLVFRLVLGYTFLMHGTQKAFEYTPTGVSASFTQMGIPAPELSAYFTVGAELIGGIMLLLGVGTRIAGAALAIAMMGAFIFVHSSAGFYEQNGGYEYVLVLIGATVMFLLTGAGKYSVDALLPGRKKK